MPTINNSVEITFSQTDRLGKNASLYVGQAKDGKTGESLKENKVYPPVVINDTLDFALKNPLLVNNIKDTTGVILEQMKAQLEWKGINLADMNPLTANSKSLEVRENISSQGESGLAQVNREFLRMLKG